MISRKIVMALCAAGITALTVVGCGSSASTNAVPSFSAGSSSTSTMAATDLKTTTINGQLVLTNAKGYTLYRFSPDTSKASNCTGACATAWPPVPGPAVAGSPESMVTGTLATITRMDGTKQATYNGHPLYTYSGDMNPGETNGNGVTAFNGLWNVIVIPSGMTQTPTQMPTTQEPMTQAPTPMMSTTYTEPMTTAPMTTPMTTPPMTPTMMPSTPMETPTSMMPTATSTYTSRGDG